MIRLSDAQRERIREQFPREHIPDGRRGRKPILTRNVLDAVLWTLNTGAQRHTLPQRYSNHKTAHRRFLRWCRSAVLREVMTELANAPREQGALDGSGYFIDAMFSPAKDGGAGVGPGLRGKDSKIMGSVNSHGFVGGRGLGHAAVLRCVLCRFAGVSLICLWAKAGTDGSLNWFG